MQRTLTGQNRKILINTNGQLWVNPRSLKSRHLWTEDDLKLKTKKEEEDLQNVDGIQKEIIEFARTYNIDGLFEACLQKLFTDLSINSAINTLIISYENKFDALKNHSIKFILKNLKEVRQSDSWKILKEYPDLLMELLDYVSN